MFTLKLKEVELAPRIEEDKSFSNENKFELESEVKMYIQEKYTHVYKNPLTIGRKVSDAIRDKKGETLNDQIEIAMNSIRDIKKDEVKAIEEERSVKEDDILYENSQKQSALMDKRFAEEKEKINVALTNNFNK